MRSRAARILVPLAVEVAFAFVVGIIIVATDGGRYGLGAKRVLVELGRRYGESTTCVGRCREVLGTYPLIEEDPSGIEEYFMRTYSFVLKKPGRHAGILRLHGGRRIAFIWADERSAMSIEDVGGPYESDWAFCGHWPPPGCMAQVSTFMNGWYSYYPPWGRYIEITSQRGRDGKRYDVLVHYGSQDERLYTWVDPDTYTVRAVARLGTENRIAKPVTELYEDVEFDLPVGDALFDIDSASLERLRAWIAERESEPTN